MALLNSPLKEEVERLIQESNGEYDKADYIKSVKLLEEAWDKLPYPKTMWDDSYHITKYIIETYLAINELQQAKMWSSIIFICDPERADSGEREFLAGKIAFEAGDSDKAKELFYVAKNKSEGRCFQGEDAKYINFIKQSV